VLRQLIGWLEIDQRPDIDASYPQTDAGLGLLRPGVGGPFGIRVNAGSPKLRLQPQRRVPYAAYRSLELGGALAGGDGAVQRQEGNKRAAPLRRQFGFNADFA